MTLLEFPNLVVHFLETRIVAGVYTPAAARDAIMWHLERGDITREEAHRLLDLKMPPRINAPGGSA